LSNDKELQYAVQHLRRGSSKINMKVRRASDVSLDRGEDRDIEMGVQCKFCFLDIVL
jgi:hypothetical protein